MSPNDIIMHALDIRDTEPIIIIIATLNTIQINIISFSSLWQINNANDQMDTTKKTATKTKICLEHTERGKERCIEILKKIKEKISLKMFSSIYLL